RLKTCSGLCSSTAPSVPPSTISSAVGWTSEPTEPPSRYCPPRIATSPSARPAILILSTALPLATFTGGRNLADDVRPQARYRLTVQLADPRFADPHDFADFPKIQILLI